MKISLTLLSCLAFSCALQSQTITRRSVDIPKLQAVPQLDGRLLDSVWNQAAREGDFTTSTPVFGQTPAGATEVYLFYTDEALYVAAVCKSIIVRTDGSVRDDLNSGDWFRIGLDTWDDDQNAFLFAVNAAGLQSDARTSSTSFDAEYDTRWQSAVAVTDGGWSVEMRIPYTALRFPPGKGEQVWGLQFTRYERSSGELSTWSPQDPNVNDGVWQFGTLRGIRDIRQGFRYSAQLYNTAEHKWGSYTNTNATLQYGADVRLGWQPNTTLDLTVLPTMTSAWRASGLSIYDNKTTKLGGDAPYPRQFNAEEGGIWAKTSLPESNPYLFTAGLENRVPAGAFLLWPEGGEPLQSLRLSTRTRQNTGISVYNAVLGPLKADYVLNGVPSFDTVLQKLSNYNVVIAEQALSNNAWVSLSNANLQAGQGVHFNRTTLSTQLRNRSNTFQLRAEQSLSRQGFGDGESALNSWRYAYSVARINRRFGWFADHSGASKGYSYSYLNYQRPSQSASSFAYSRAGISWSDFRPKGRVQNYNASLSSNYTWGENYSKGFWNGLSLSVVALDRRFQSWGLYSNFWRDGSTQFYFYNNNSLTRQLSASSSYRFNFQSDQRKRFTWSASIGGTLYREHENDGISMDLRPRWVLNSKWIIGAYSLLDYTKNNLVPTDFIQGEWAFLQYNERNLETGLSLHYFLTRRWWIGAETGLRHRNRPNQELVVLKPDRSLDPVPGAVIADYNQVEFANFRFSLQWQLRQIDYLRFSYNYRNNRDFFINNPFPSGNSARNEGLQLQMIFFLDGAR